MLILLFVCHLVVWLKSKSYNQTLLFPTRQPSYLVTMTNVYIVGNSSIPFSTRSVHWVEKVRFRNLVFWFVRVKKVQINLNYKFGLVQFRIEAKGSVVRKKSLQLGTNSTQLVLDPETGYPKPINANWNSTRLDIGWKI